MLRIPAALRAPLPGILLCTFLALVSWAVGEVEARLLGRAWLEPLVLAILLGAAVANLRRPGRAFAAGIGFSAKTLLECAVMLLGLSVSVAALAGQGRVLLGGIALVVVASIALSYAIGRACGLRGRLALLVACGNSICGNSAIAAVAPVIGAESDDIVSSIAFTAILGVAAVLLLPLAVPLLHLSASQYGVLAGLTVYAVPQVLAATVPVGALAVQIGTLVKLVRVLMLGPVVLALSLGARRGGGIAWRRLVPWFILGFLALAALRAAGLVPQALLGPAALLANLLTIISMAALGLGVDLRVVRRVGGRVMLAASVALLALAAISLGLIRGLGVA